jgi:lysine-N-methylase
MTDTLQITRFTAEFQCLADRCEDTCCKGWGMQVDAGTVEKYRKDAPELLAAVDTGEAEFIMKRDATTDYCVKFDGGLCSLHRDYGTAFLGDACHFYPRISRRLGERTTMTASLSCPEITRLALFGQGTGWQDDTVNRLPYSLRDYLPEGLTAAQAWTVHQAFLNAVAEAPTAERALACLVSVAHSLPALPLPSWPEATAFYLRMANGRLPTAEPDPADAFNLLHTMFGLLSAAKASRRVRLELTLTEMAEALGVTFDPQTRQITLGDDSYARWQSALALWQAQPQAARDGLLRRWLETQIGMMLFPFAGLGATLPERTVLLALRFAVTRLALLCATARRQALPDEAETVRIVQSLSRFLDHLADPALSLQICRDTGWIREARLRALIGDGVSDIPLCGTALRTGVAN